MVDGSEPLNSRADYNIVHGLQIYLTCNLYEYYFILYKAHCVFKETVLHKNKYIIIIKYKNQVSSEKYSGTHKTVIHLHLLYYYPYKHIQIQLPPQRCP